ncbi:MAG: diguanylate cyclase [Candidatus Hydrogenedentes bacterium]|nr:diguanylate cyclase [Candidatus Hydrogenedentota bacterium]
MREHRGIDARDSWESTEVYERKLRSTEQRLSAVTHELALRSNQLALIRGQMAEATERRIEEERLKVVLQMAGATTAELDQPLVELLRVSAELEADASCTPALSARIADLKSHAKQVQQIIDRIQHVQADLLLPVSSATSMDVPEGRYRVLIVEGEDIFASSVCDLLEPWSATLELSRASDCASAEKALLANRFDLILSDYQLPDGASLDLFTRLALQIELPPFILISGQGSEDLVAQAVRRGACDYLPKLGLDQDRLIQSILAALERVRLRQELQTAHRHLAEMATRDELTGLFNRRYLMQSLETELNRARRYHQPLTLCMFDLDHFKQLNDCHGHEAGDTVLRSVARTLQHTVRSPDIAGRYGGEEFMILLINTDIHKAELFSNRLRERIGEQEFHFPGVRSLVVTCSIGLSQYKPGEQDSAALISHTDKAMYNAKRHGRNQVCCLH